MSGVIELSSTKPQHPAQIRGEVQRTQFVKVKTKFLNNY